MQIKKILKFVFALFLMMVISTSCDHDSSDNRTRETLQSEKEMRSYVSFTKEYDTFTCTYHFSSSLCKKFSPADFKYCIEFGDGDNLDWYVYHNDSSESTFSMQLYMAIGDNWGGIDFYMMSFKNLEKKMANGEKLSKAEQAFYNNLKKVIQGMMAAGFKSRAYIEMNGVKYYLE